MTNDHNDKNEDDTPEARTIFSPQTPLPQAEVPEPQAMDTQSTTAAEEASPMAQVTVPPPPVAAEPSTPPMTAPTRSETTLDRGTSFTPMAPRLDGDRIQIGDVLNHIFEVKRFIARGGMGEVFEGVNINSEERVAIKVMLPQLAADPSVQAMFKKEARTLTKLAHPALVQYRVIATEPQLGVLYIVTEYIDGKNLEDVISTIKATPKQLLAVTRQLADGLRVAHSLGAIHRDISPDNVLLENGELEKARIIDFGIAKDLDPSSKTIVGDGFAGKLNFVAPEQLGDFNREVGPWTDVYSLGLVILSIAMGKGVNMGGTLVDAVDKRRQGPDLSVVPEAIKPLLTDMLRPNPQDRLRSMDEVIARIDQMNAAASPNPAKAQQPSQASKPKAEPAKKPVTDSSSAGGGGASLDGLLKNKQLMMYGGGGVALLAVIIVGLMMMGGPKKPKTEPNQPNASAQTFSEEEVIAAINTQLPADSCQWLEVKTHEMTPQGLKLSLIGVAADTILAQKSVADMITSKGFQVADINADGVAPMQQRNACPLINEYSKIRSTEPGTMSSPQVVYEMDIQPNATDYPKNTKLSQPIFTFGVDKDLPDIAIYGLQTTGEVAPLINSKKEFLPSVGPIFSDLGNGRYEFKTFQDQPGWAGILILKGKGPFNPSLISPPLSNSGAAWQAAFRDAAQKGGWHAEMLWVKSEDKTAN